MRLTVKQVERETTPGRYFDGDGDGLLLTVRRRSGRLEKVWSLRYVSPVTKRRREKGLGSFPKIRLDRARKEAQKLRVQIEAGIDPLGQQPGPDGGKDVTLASATAAFIKTKAPGWRDPKLERSWRNTLTTYCESINARPVADIDRADIVSVLAPIWLTKMEQASRVRGRLKRILDFAVAQGWRPDHLANPAVLDERLKALLPDMPSKAVRVRHRPSLPWQELPAFMIELRKRPALSARMAEFTILTACRVGEATGALWSELDPELTTWVIPAPRMKMKRPHRVPINSRVRELIEGLHPLGPPGPVVFSTDGMTEPSENSMRALLIRMGFGHVTMHGMRSTFRTWCADHGKNREAAELALAHVVAGVEGAYQRGDLLEVRRKLMLEWEAFCNGA